MIVISYKDKYNKYEDLNITDFEDQIELLFTVNDQLVDGDSCVDIVANAETISLLCYPLQCQNLTMLHIKLIWKKMVPYIVLKCLMMEA